MRPRLTDTGPSFQNTTSIAGTAFGGCRFRRRNGSAFLATTDPTRMLVLEAPFTSMCAMVEETTPCTVRSQSHAGHEKLDVCQLSIQFLALARIQKSRQALPDRVISVCGR